MTLAGGGETNKLGDENCHCSTAQGHMSLHSENHKIQKNTLFLRHALPFVEIYVKQRKQKKYRTKTWWLNQRRLLQYQYFKWCLHQEPPAFSPQGAGAKCSSGWVGGHLWKGGNKEAQNIPVQVVECHRLFLRKNIFQSWGLEMSFLKTICDVKRPSQAFLILGDL